jgi:hypothetical protein
MSRGGRDRKKGPRHPNGERKLAREAVMTPERRQHGIVEMIEKPIGDDAGRPSRPYRTVDLLGTLHRRGSITAEMRQTGEDFRSQFAIAQLNPLKAGDPGRPLAHGAAVAEVTPTIERARDSVWRAMRSVGGIGSPAGSCLWHVVGWESTPTEWALAQGWKYWASPEDAFNILIAALGQLEAYYGGSRR